MGSWVQRALITKGALVETANRRNRLHHGGLWERTVFRIGTALTSLLIYNLAGKEAVMAHYRGMRGGVDLTDTSAQRWFKALPSRQFGTVFTHRLATVNRVTDN